VKILRPLADLVLERGKTAPAHITRGKLGEDAAYRHLRKLGYTVVARNYRTRDGRGEVDLIGWDQEQLAFVEVKTRRTEEFGAPEAAIDPPKRRNIIRAAADYLRRSGIEWGRARFDTASVVTTENGIEVQLQKDAFSRGSAPPAVRARRGV
jgi:putative endonuclease